MICGKLSEVVEAQRGERRAVVANLPRLPTENRTNSGQRKAFEDGGNASAGANGEHEFVFLATVEGLFERRSREARGIDNLGGNTRGESEAPEIEGEAIAEVDGRCGAEGFADVVPELEARFGVEMAFAGLAFACSEAESRAAELARDVDFVAGSGSAAQERR